MTTTATNTAEANGAHVRALLAERQPHLAAVLEVAARILTEEVQAMDEHDAPRYGADQNDIDTDWTEAGQRIVNRRTLEHATIEEGPTLSPTTGMETITVMYDGDVRLSVIPLAVAEPE